MQGSLRNFIMLPAVVCVLALGACSNFRQQSFDIFADEAPKANAKNIDIHATTFRLAEMAYEKGEYGMAAQLYFRVAEQAPKTPDVTAKLGLALLNAGSAADAERIFHAVLEKEPRNALALRGLGHGLVLQKRPAQALAYYRQAIAASARPEPRNYAGLGAALDMVGKHEEARAAYAAGLLLAPQDVGLRNNLAISYALSGDTAKAKKILAGLAANHPASRPEIYEESSSVDAIKTSSARRLNVRKRGAVAAARPRDAGLATVHTATPALEPEVIEMSPPVRVTRISRKTNADRPMADAESSEILIVTGRAPPARADSRHQPAMSFRSSASTPEEAAKEVLALLELAARGPRFVWQEAQR